MPFDLTVASHPSDLYVRVVFGCLHPAGVGTCGRPVSARGRYAAQGLVRALLVVMTLKALQISLLGCQATLRRLDMLLQPAMHTLMTAVLVRTPRSNELHCK